MSLKRKRRISPGRTFLFILLFLITGSTVACFFLFFEGKKPTVDLSALPEFLARNDLLVINAADVGNGLKKIEVYAIQGGEKKPLLTEENPRKTYIGQVGPAMTSREVEFDASKLGFLDGEVTIQVTATDFSFRGFFSGNNTTALKTLKLDTKPPKVRILHSERYIVPGGAGIAIYQNSDPGGQHGVVINGHFNPGYPVPDGRKNTYITYFALPYDATTIEESRIIAQDVAGNAVTVPFSVTLKNSPQKKDRINVGDGFLNKKIPEFEQYYPEMTGSMLEKYLMANRGIRKDNNKKISELCANPSEDQLWDGRFIRMSGSSRAGFADHRTYFYEGNPIDQQVHLGMDIASTRRADVKAANSGKVVFADYLGIYGNMVLLDHGQGVFSLYSHLSQINVAVDDMAAKGDVIGLTGASGMAGGDHLHFSMLVNGVFATPKEWWDPHWIEVTITEPLVDSKF
ncbi:M23 family metallopeptidase [Desulfopila sp. IMCC35008]|uniref:M23 family metallopeptidase n=1 Tax=Desulfopila sp. IMCC35008 TaxID=2653858 RepID=UPI0013D651A9|nr:M23 family metallopeptidase [Desulfopila sp. IMCC35008]